MINKRLELSLERLTSSDWARFEKLSSAFLSTEFDDLRTVASPAGDEGRDAELFSPFGESNVVIQYSVASDRGAKIRATVKRLNETMRNITVLVYMSNQTVGADADALKRQLRRDFGLSLDVRDRGWFIERVNGNTTRQVAAEELAEVLVDPLLASAGVGPHVKSELSSSESIAAVTFLGLQWHDDVRDKGLTKLAFEALLRAVLVHTRSDRRMTQEQIYDSFAKLLPGHAREDLAPRIDSALRKLQKQVVKVWNNNEYHLAHEEVQRLQAFLLDASIAEQNLVAAIRTIASHRLSGLGSNTRNQEAAFADALREALDLVLLEQSQAFAMAVHAGSLDAFSKIDFDSSLLAVLNRSPLKKNAGGDWLNLMRGGLRDVLVSNNPSVQEHLRSLSDSYTLMAFLKQTPDVQGAVEKMFSSGVMWVDATVILPLFAETLGASDDERGRFTRMISAAHDAGIKLFVTPGIVEEVERHMNRSLVCARMEHGVWEGPSPYLLSEFLSSGRSRTSFAAWLENFRGDSRPLDDLADYLEEEFSILLRDLDDESKAAGEDLRYALEQIWYARHKWRREQFGIQIDDATVTRLVNHDVECYAGVIHLRSKEDRSMFGFNTWWLTVDRQAYNLRDKLRELMSGPPPPSPVMSADFLLNYLAFGPNRRKLHKASESRLPVMLELGAASRLTPELISAAEAVRASMQGQPERVIRRRVRDYLDDAKARIGPIAVEGISEAQVRS